MSCGAKVLHLPSLIVSHELQLTGGNHKEKESESKRKNFCSSCPCGHSATRFGGTSLKSRKIVRLPSLKLGDYRKMTRVRRIVVSPGKSFASCQRNAPSLRLKHFKAQSSLHSQKETKYIHTHRDRIFAGKDSQHAFFFLPFLLLVL